jgi:DNA-binding NarL/FixJ family response regulator
MTRVALAILNIGGESIASPGPSSSVAALNEQMPEVPLVVISDLAQADESVRALRIGAQGHIPTTTPPEIALKALSFILAGGSFFPPTALLQPVRGNGPIRRDVRTMRGLLSEDARRLTQRQTEVLELLHKGLSNKVIAQRLDLRESTVKVHMRQILRKLGVQNRTEAALRGPLQETTERNVGVPPARARLQ